MSGMPLFRRKKDLIIAAQNGDLEKVKECLDGNADQVKQAANYCEILDGYEGWTPLHHACNSHGHRRDGGPRADLSNYVQIVEALLAAGADMNSTSSPGMLKTPLDFAWSQADFSLLEVLIKKCREKLSPISLLCTACVYVRLDMVTLLLDEGVDVNLTDEHGFTPLHRACLENLSTRSDRDGEIVQMLLNKGADITVTDPSGATAPDLAFSYASVRVVEVLLNKHPELINAQALHKAALHDRFETVELLVGLHKVDVNSPDEHRWTALHHACQRGQIDMIKFLLQKDADITRVNKEGKTALAVADEVFHPTLLQLFKASKASLERGPASDFTGAGSKAMPFADATISGAPAGAGAGAASMPSAAPGSPL